MTRMYPDLSLLRYPPIVCDCTLLAVSLSDNKSSPQITARGRAQDRPAPAARFGTTRAIPGWPRPAPRRRRQVARRADPAHRPTLVKCGQITRFAAALKAIR